ncbi:hypothetical protein FA95DRAFT_1677180 [Auriscalpium vulgare]|uniref:Uncharacterized protein n=1 Tax=Auriscalpium vulgare TaxID=40419 RepID=A0ACB8S0N9_9AGAM|nr:hypothetical protein FA95DRAFT_1677180 [Auriscalpium vulgare]
MQTPSPAADATTYWNDVANPRLVPFDTTCSTAVSPNASSRLMEELVGMERIALDLRARHNALVPIHRLSKEVLVTIFKLCDDVPDVAVPDAAAPEGEGQPPLEGRTRLTSIERTCRLWRDVALKTRDVPAITVFNASVSEEWVDRPVSTPSAAALYWEAAARTRTALLAHPTPLSLASELSELLHRVTAEREGLRRVLATFRSHFNALAPVSRLPRELLAYTFSIALALEAQLAAKQAERRRLDLSHVSQEWRAVAVGHARLWNYISFNKGDWWAEEKLARVRLAPIVFRATGPHPLTVRHGELAAAHFAHTKELYLHAERDAVRAVYDVLKVPAPYLDVLTCRITPATPDVMTLPTPLFGERPPERIRVIELQQIDAFPWTSPALTKHLACLHLTFATASSAPPPSMDEVFDALERTPSLVHLSIIGVLPPHNSATRFRTIVLPRLTHLALDGHVRDCLALLKPVRMTDGLYADIEVSRGQPPEGAAPNATAFVFNMNLSPTVNSFGKVDLGVNIVDNALPGVIALRVWRVSPPTDQPLPPPDVLIHLRVGDMHTLP